MSQFKSNLKKSIIQGNFELVLKLLLKKTQGPQNDEVVHLSSRFTELKKKKIRHTISPSQVNLEQNQLTESLLVIIDDLPNDSNQFLGKLKPYAILAIISSLFYLAYFSFDTNLNPVENLEKIGKQKIENENSKRQKLENDIAFTAESKKESKQKTFASPQRKAKPYTDEYILGKMDSTKISYFESKGFCVIDNEKYSNQAQAILMATRCAKIVAQAELLEQIKGAKIKGEDTVENLILTDSKIKSKVEGIIRGAYQVGEAKILDASVEVIFRIQKQQIKKLID